MGCGASTPTPPDTPAALAVSVPVAEVAGRSEGDGSGGEGRGADSNAEGDTEEAVAAAQAELAAKSAKPKKARKEKKEKKEKKKEKKAVEGEEAADGDTDVKLAGSDGALTSGGHPTHMGGGDRVQHDAAGKLLFKMAQVTKVGGNEELTCTYPAYGQAFPMEMTNAHGLQQDVFPPVEWFCVPINDCGSPAGDAPWAAKLDAVVQGYIADRKLPGGCQLALARSGRLIFSKAYGVADIMDETAAPMSADARLYMGSISKSITAVAAMLLVQDGKLSLDGCIYDLLSGDRTVLEDERVGLVTVRMCLNHTSGLTDAFGGMGTALSDHKTVSSTAAMLSTTKLSSDPGSKYEYGNLNANVMGRVIDAVTGQDYEAVVRARIWDPLGRPMPVVSSKYKPHDGEVPFYHPTRPGQVKPDKSNLYWKYLWGGRHGAQGNKEIGGEGAGGWKGSAADLALLGADLLSALQGEPSKLGLTAATVKAMVGNANGAMDAFKPDAPQLWSSQGWISFAVKPALLTVDAPAAVWSAQVGQFFHNGTFGSALHVETFGGGVSWAFCLNAPPHFEGMDIDHVAEPAGLKAQVRQVVQEFMFQQGGTFTQW